MKNPEVNKYLKPLDEILRKNFYQHWWNLLCLMMKEFCIYYQLETKAQGFQFLKNARQFRIQPAITCSKLTIETLEQDVKYVQK